VSNAEHGRENWRSALFSTKSRRYVQKEDFLLQLCNAKDLTIRSRSRLSSEFLHALRM
jgi:hypothetical protein